ncbi:hypothetical protein [Streptomyces paradoxus]|uniref:Uncharacterized protein n=1 Tax=Streptomyces paradoxus TaxID=66375 RepID=A0A7W9TDF9_9ACTN|nr:hypothetical protein [Streptomyces paradoxus]MBB6077402.1 hypothetical protein [Streptomyces paradoxus]
MPAAVRTVIGIGPWGSIMEALIAILGFLGGGAAGATITTISTRARNRAEIERAKAETRKAGLEADRIIAEIERAKSAIQESQSSNTEAIGSLSETISGTASRVEEVARQIEDDRKVDSVDRAVLSNLIRRASEIPNRRLNEESLVSSIREILGDNAEIEIEIDRLIRSGSIKRLASDRYVVTEIGRQRIV